MRRQIATAEEQDVHTRWRHYLKFRRGEITAMKRRTNRRERQAGKSEARDELSW